jgi:hypothetical protein
MEGGKHRAQSWEEKIKYEENAQEKASQLSPRRAFVALRLRLIGIALAAALLGFGITFFYWGFGVLLGRAFFVSLVDALPLYVLLVALPSFIFRKRQPPFRALKVAEEICGVIALALLLFSVGVWIGAWVDARILFAHLGQAGS